MNPHLVNALSENNAPYCGMCLTPDHARRNFAHSDLQRCQVYQQADLKDVLLATKYKSMPSPNVSDCPRHV